MYTLVQVFVCGPPSNIVCISILMFIIPYTNKSKFYGKKKNFDHVNALCVSDMWSY